MKIFSEDYDVGDGPRLRQVVLLVDPKEAQALLEMGHVACERFPRRKKWANILKTLKEMPVF